MTWPVTLADRPLLMRQYWVHANKPGAVFDPTLSTTRVFAPCCGRKTPADTVVSLEGLVTEIKGGNYRPKANLDWACDGCRHLLIADQSNGWTWAKLFHALGAPASAIRYERAKELVREEERAASDRKEWFSPGEAFERVHSNLLSDVRDLPGTERPDV